MTLAFKMRRQREDDPIKVWPFLGLCLSGILPISGCKESRVIHTANPPATVDANGLRISAVLNRAGSPYSFQEDILLKVAIMNLLARETLIPHLPAHPATWELRDNSTGDTREQAYRPVAPPGVPRDIDPPESLLQPNGEHVYSLQVQAHLGELSPGRYSLRYRLDSATMPLLLPWLDFEVGASSIGDHSLAPSNRGNAEEIWLAWHDKAIQPGRILWRRAPISGNRNLPPRTGLIPAGNVTSGPVVSTTSMERPRTPWVGWLETEWLHILRESNPDSLITVTSKIPEPGPWTLVRPLQSSGSATAPIVSGILTRTEGGSTLMIGFTFQGGESVAWEESIRIPGTPTLPPKLVSWSNTRVVTWVETDHGRNQIVFVPWNPNDRPGPPKSVTRLPIQSGTLIGFEAEPDMNTIVLALAIRTQARKEGRMEVHSMVLDPGTRLDLPGKRSIWYPDLKPSISSYQLALDGKGRPWLLQAGRDGCWVQSEEWKTATLIGDSEGMDSGHLFFKKGDIPKAILLGGKSGFQARSINHPDGGDTSDDWVEDNE